MLTRPPSTRSVWPINSVKASNSINASVDCCCPTAARYINMLTRPPSTRSVWPINSINTSESRKFGSEVHSYFVRPIFDGRHNTAYGPYALQLHHCPYPVSDADSIPGCFQHNNKLKLTKNCNVDFSQCIKAISCIISTLQNVDLARFSTIGLNFSRCFWFLMRP